MRDCGRVFVTARATLAAALPSIAAAAAAAPVRTQSGWIQGSAEDGLTVYRGIPFAAPPIGRLRWRAPQPAAKWDGTRQAAKFAPGCMQATRPNGPAVSEDCLYL